jgi:hypothetical protein
MPLGYPQKSPVFEYNPNLHSFLPNVMDSNASLINVIEDRREESTFNGAINLQELSQLVWASYGFSYFIDITDSSTNQVERHRTVPSSHCTYPLVLYVVTKSGIFRYFPHVIRLNPYSDSPLYSVNWQFPVISFLLPIRLGDYRDEIAESCSQKSIASSPMIIIPILPLSSLYKVPWPWYYEAGASAYNVMLESEILDLHASIVRPTDSSLINAIVRLPYDSLPLLVIPVGR